MPNNTFMHLFLIVIFSAFTAFPSFATNLDKSRYMQGMGNIDYFPLPKGKQNYHIYVRQPEAQNDTQKLTTVYLLDGGITFPLLSSYYHLLKVVQDLPNIIIVGISYGSDDWQQGNNRGHDFSLASKERDYWGGAPQFARYLQQELIPYIESHYPAEPNRRVLWGNSLGGQFGIYMAMHHPDTFQSIALNNPALHTNTEMFLEHSTLAKAKRPTQLLITRADNDAEQFKTALQRWLDYWHKQPQNNWQLTLNPVTQHNHMSSIPTSFRFWLNSLPVEP